MSASLPRPSILVLRMTSTGIKVFQVKVEGWLVCQTGRESKRDLLWDIFVLDRMMYPCACGRFLTEMKVLHLDSTIFPHFGSHSRINICHSFDTFGVRCE